MGWRFYSRSNNIQIAEASLFPVNRISGYQSAAKGYDEYEGETVTTVDTNMEIDWTACELIEQVAGKVSGKPVVRGTRILPDAIVGSFDLGETIEELHDGFPTLSVVQIKRLIEFAHSQRGSRSR